MTATIDTSVWLEMLRDKTGSVAARMRSATGERRVVLLPPVLLELLQGCRDEAAWNVMSVRVSTFTIVRTPDDWWRDAARLYFELRVAGKTVRSALDCCIAIYALTNDLTLIHNDRDFDAIASVRPLKHIRLDVSKANP